jgi:CDGSH iron-sulfur domain-containing protein 3
MSDEPVCAQKSPYQVTLEEGKAYFWCTCGRSAKQPFCDGSHKAFGLAPLEYTATATTQVWFCGCKSTKSQPMCDGTHKTL